MKKRKFATRAIHGGQEKEFARALNPPIFMTSTFSFPSLEQAEGVFDFQAPGYVYTRGNNPTLKLFEERMADLEEGAEAVAFASGMAAITSTLLSLLKPGDEVLAHRVLYGSSHRVIQEFLPRYGIKTGQADLVNLQELGKRINPETRVVFLETPANPTLDILDLRGIREIIGSEVALVVDNTLVSPYWQRPLNLGADVVVHSATKYISGHGDALGGVAVCKEQELAGHLKFKYLTELGGGLSPFNAWLLLRGIKTLRVRMEEHGRNALKLAHFLQEHPRVKKVYYPGLPGHPGHELARRQMEGFGGLIALELKGGAQAARQLLSGLEMIKLAVSLGDTETLIEYPFAMTHRDYSPDQLQEYGLNESLLRISVGLEDAEDIIRDLEQALQGL